MHHRPIGFYIFDFVGLIGDNGVLSVRSKELHFKDVGLCRSSLLFKNRELDL